VTARAAMMRTLHARLREAGVDDASYRDRLEREFNVRSAKDLDDKQLARAAQMFPVKQKANFPHTRKVKALWIALANLGAADPQDTALDAFVMRQTGKQKLAFITPAEANSVTEALKDMLAREGFVPRGDACKVRNLLLEAQWKKLHALGAVYIDSNAALWAWLDKRYGGGRCGGHQDMTEEQLDEAAKALGRWIREKQKQKAGAA
jgi:hypothetical protein